MNKKVWLSILAGAVLVAGVIFGVSRVQTVSADAPLPPTGYGMLDPGRGDRWIDSEGLAEALGISVDELEAAYQTATDKALEQAVAADLITQIQADLIRERGAFGFGMRMAGFMGSEIDFQALLADALGITPDELLAAQQTAARNAIEDAVAAGQITQEQADLMLGRHALRNSEAFQSSMTGAYEAAIQAALTDGVITRAQADALLADLEANGLVGTCGGPGIRGGGRGMRGW